jgi:predicted acetyltransferase
MIEQSQLASRVSLDPVSEADRALIDGLAQFYIYDFSEMSPISDTDFAFDRSGAFWELPGIDDYWEQEGAYALAIRFDGRTAGFVLINTQSHRDGGIVERNMGEFFVARQFRHNGIGAEAVRQVLAAYPGKWEVAIVEHNSGAKAFWPRAIAAASNVSGLKRVEGDDAYWTGPIWCFNAA